MKISDAVAITKIDDLPAALHYSKFQNLVGQVLAKEDEDYIGFKTLIETFDDFVLTKLEAAFGDKSEDIRFEYGKRIHDYVMDKLSPDIWQIDR